MRNVSLGNCRQATMGRYTMGSALPLSTSLNPINIFLQYVATIIDEMILTTNYNEVNYNYIKEYYDRNGFPIDTALQSIRYDLWQQKTKLANIKIYWRPYFQKYDIYTLGAAVTTAIIVSAVGLLGVGVAWALVQSTREETQQLKMRIDAAKAGLDIPDKQPLFDFDLPEWVVPAGILTFGLVALGTFAKRKG